MKNILERIKTDKDYRFDFIIAIWSGVIIIAVIIALIFGIVYVSGKINNKPEEPETSSEPVVTLSPAPSFEPTITPDMEDIEDTDLDDADSPDEEEEDNEQTGSNDIVYATTTVNVRKDSTTESESLGKITAGTQVTRLENMTNGWSKVLYNGGTAYIKSEFLSTKPVSATGIPASNTVSPKTTVKPSSKKTTASANAPVATATPKTKPAKTQDSTETTDSSVNDTEPVNTSAPVYSEPTSVPPVSDNLTGIDSVNTPNDSIPNAQ